MKRALSLFALLVLGALAAGSLLADDNAFVGTWKLNVAKSKFSPGPAPQSMTRTVVAQGDGAKYTFDVVAADGSTKSYSFETTYDGKDFPITGSGAPGGADTIALKRVSSHKVEATLKRGGKVSGTSVAEVSADGKTTTLHTKGTNPDGKPYSSSNVYDKQ